MWLEEGKKRLSKGADRGIPHSFSGKTAASRRGWARTDVRRSPSTEERARRHLDAITIFNKPRSPLRWEIPDSPASGKSDTPRRVKVCIFKRNYAVQLQKVKAEVQRPTLFNHERLSHPCLIRTPHRQALVWSDTLEGCRHARARLHSSTEPGGPSRPTREVVPTSDDEISSSSHSRRQTRIQLRLSTESTAKSKDGAQQDDEDDQEVILPTRHTPTRSRPSPNTDSFAVDPPPPTAAGATIAIEEPDLLPPIQGSLLPPTTPFTHQSSPPSISGTRIFPAPSQTHHLTM